MKKVLAVVMLAAPNAALAGGKLGEGCSHGSGGGCHLGSVLLAATAALGFWVLRHAEKDTGTVRWAGRAVGWTLLVLGLLGFLCGAWSHMSKASSGGHACNHEAATPVPRMGMMEMPPGHPHIGDMTKEDFPPSRSGKKRP